MSGIYYKSSSQIVTLYIHLGRVHILRTHFLDIEDDVNMFINTWAKYLCETARIFFAQD
jgi:hypothetical protein